MNEDWMNVTSIEVLNKYEPISIEGIMHQLDNVMMVKLLYIGIFALLCGAWNMSKYSKRDDIITTAITGFIDMASFASGVAAFAFYAIYRGWM